jgi:hypothetical protein
MKPDGAICRIVFFPVPRPNIRRRGVGAQLHTVAAEKLHHAISVELAPNAEFT